MKAIILAAGAGTRLAALGSQHPKCLALLAGVPLLRHQQHTLNAAGVTDVTVVTGHGAQAIEALGYRTIHNPQFADTNMVASLMCAAPILDGQEEILVSYGDIVYERRVLEALTACRAPMCTTIDTEWLQLWRMRVENPLAHAETLRMNPAGQILELGRTPRTYQDIQGQYMGLTKLTPQAARDLVQMYRALDPHQRYDGHTWQQMYMTSLLQCAIDQGRVLQAVPVSGGWLEVDTAKDLELYNRLSQEGTLSDLCRLESVTLVGPAR